MLLTPTGDYLEESAAAAVLGEFIEAPPEDLRFALLHGVRFGNVGSYRHLQRICLRMIPRNADRALMLAELAVQMIAPHRELMGEAADDWQALAWTFLARVQTHLGRSGAAEQSLGFACAEVGGVDGLAPWVEIKWRQVQGALRSRQRRYDEAEHALDRAVDLGRDLPPIHPDRSGALLQRVELASAHGDVEAGLALCNELEAVLAEQDAGDRPSGAYLTLWHGFVSYHRGRAATANGHDCCAETLLRQTIDDIAADPLCDTDTALGLLFTFALHKLARVTYRGERLDECERWLRFTVERYRWLGVAVFEAAAEAELAVVCALRGQRAEARQLAASAAAFLDDLPFHREAWNAAHQLRDLAEGGTDAPAEELMDALAALAHDLDLVSWEIAAAQARPAVEARRAAAQAHDSGAQARKTRQASA